MTVQTYNHSTFLAKRAADAAKIGPPVAPSHVALPGARAAIPHDRLLAHQDAEHSAEEIVDRINRRWERENADRLQAHRDWARGPYAGAIQQLRDQATREQAEQLRRRALFEQLTGDHGA